MRPFQYHEGQRDVQREANSIPCADKLSSWVGPVVDYANEADLIVLACAVPDALHVAVLSGPAPLVSAAAVAGEIAVEFPREVSDQLPLDQRWGGIVINPSTARRSRVAGLPTRQGAGVVIMCEVAFTNCRKYMTPTSSTGETTHYGPTRQDPVALDDPWIVQTVTGGETAFLVTETPDGVADVSHRGGPPGTRKRRRSTSKAHSTFRAPRLRWRVPARRTDASSELKPPPRCLRCRKWGCSRGGSGRDVCLYVLSRDRGAVSASRQIEGEADCHRESDIEQFAHRALHQEQHAQHRREDGEDRTTRQ